MEQLDLLSWRNRPWRRSTRKKPCEWKVVAVREVNLMELPICQTPQDAVDYWAAHIATAPHFNPDVECFAVFLLNVKNRIRGHQLISIGSLNETVCHPREVFRAAVVGAACSIVLMHNHPSGDSSPSMADRKMTRLLVDAGKLLRIAVEDHVIVGYRNYYSMRERNEIK